LTRISTYVHIIRVRRKPGALVPFETAICVAAARLHADGTVLFHGYLLAKELADAEGRRPGYGTLYRALDRLNQMELLASVWEDPHDAAAANRPRRRLYSITDKGLTVAAEARRADRTIRHVPRLARV
jgi:DNA-binding MarR family transcriptional regulator